MQDTKSSQLNENELDKVNGGYDIPSPYYAPPGGYPHNRPHITCRCGFQTASPDEYASHIAQNPDHINMRYGR